MITVENVTRVYPARPGQIIAELPIRLPRPRSWDIVLSEEFLALKRQVLEIMRPDLTRHLATI